MSTKNSRSGGKFTGSHTTVVPAARDVADIAANNSLVTKIALGIIKAGLPSAKGRKAVKIKPNGACLLLSVRDNTTCQELYVYAAAADLKDARNQVAEKARKEGFQVTVVE